MNVLLAISTACRHVLWTWQAIYS